MNGYAGSILRVDLSSGTVKKEPLNPHFSHDFLGGMGFGVRYLYNEQSPDTPALAPQAKLVFGTGPITATLVGTAGRYVACFKSPLTDILCDSSSGGFWGAELRQAGYDVLILEGRSPSPVYIRIHNDQVTIHPAQHLWGKDTEETKHALTQEIDDLKARIMCIGPAGENLVLYAGILNDEGRVAGRGGGGAVMGSKNLKAIVARGTQPITLANPAEFKRIAIDINKRNTEFATNNGMRELGTARGLDNNWPISDIPVKNWSLGSSQEICTSLGGRKMRETILIPGYVGCLRCTIGCSRWVRIQEEPYVMDGPGPEFETLGALGTNCMVGDLNAVSYAAHLCNLYGMDTITAGATIAFAMECYEKGYIDKKDTGGLAIDWGDKELLVNLVHQIGRNEGFGKMLALGSRKLAWKVGHDSIDFTVQSKGMEHPMHDQRAFYGWAANYATSPRGACHLHGMSSFFEEKQSPLPEWGLTGFYPRQSDENKGKVARMAQNWGALVGSLVLCYFASFPLKPSDLAALVNASTGTEYTSEDMLVIGERINALYRSYNYRCGVRRADDSLTPRALMPLAEGGAAGKTPNLEVQLAEYYAERQWEPDGKPSRASLIALGLEDAAQDLFAPAV